MSPTLGTSDGSAFEGGPPAHRGRSHVADAWPADGDPVRHPASSGAGDGLAPGAQSTGRGPAKAAGDDTHPVAARPRRGLRATFGSLDTTARDYLLVVAFAFGALEATFSVFGLWLDRVHGVPLAQLGGFAAVVAVGELVGAGLVTVVADRIGKARTLMIGLGVCAIGLVALAVTSTLSFGVGALAIGLVGSETAIVAAIAIASEVQPEARSRYLALMFAITSFTRAVVGGVGPAVFATVGITGNVSMSVVAAGVAALLLRRAVVRTPSLAA